jgi:hypothetical protein
LQEDELQEDELRDDDEQWGGDLDNHDDQQMDQDEGPEQPATAPVSAAASKRSHEDGADARKNVGKEVIENRDGDRGGDGHVKKNRVIMDGIEIPVMPKRRSRAGPTGVTRRKKVQGAMSGGEIQAKEKVKGGKGKGKAKEVSPAPWHDEGIGSG